MKRIILLAIFIIAARMVSAQDADSAKFICGKSTVEYAGQIYNTVKIGSQCWLKKNLNVGTMISGNTEQSKKVGMIEKYCYNDDSANCTTYGGLYQWDEAMQYNSESTQGICPKGWHMPAMDELQALSSAVNNDGNAIKATGQGVGDGAGTNVSGFSALFTGFHHYDGYFDGLKTYVRIWSSSEGDPETAYLLRLTSSGSKVYLYDNNKTYGLTVRCLKD